MPIDMLQDPTGATLFNNMFDNSVEQEQPIQEDMLGEEPIEDSFLASLDEFEKQNQDQDVQEQIKELRQQFELQLQSRDLDEQQQRLEEQLAMQDYYSSSEGQEAIMEKYNTNNYTPQPVEEPMPRYTTTGNVKTKNNNVNINEINYELKNMLSEISNKFPGLIITSGNDSKHTPNSTHYDNDAVDIGANSSNKTSYNRLKKYVPILKQNGFNVIDEGDHLHISNSKKGKK